MVLVVGDTEMVAPVPTSVPPQLPEYQVQAAPEPKEPPETDRVVALPEQTGLILADALVGAVENVFKVTVTDAQLVVLQVPTALT